MSSAVEPTYEDIVKSIKARPTHWAQMFLSLKTDYAKTVETLLYLQDENKYLVELIEENENIEKVTLH